MNNAFRGERYFLSNMYPCRIVLSGYEFTCAEAAFQACKDGSRVKEFAGLDGYAAKRLGRRVKLSPNWLDARVGYMKIIVREKFRQNPDLAAKLLATGEEELVEENTWGDTFWGRVNGKGLNTLGEILMEVREEMEQA